MKLLSTAQAAARLGVTVTRVQALILDRRLPAQHIGRDYVIREEDLPLVEDRRAGRTPGQLQLEYWTAFAAYLRSKGVPFNVPEPQAQRYMAFGIGASGFRIAASVRPRDGQIWVDLTLDGRHAKKHFQILEQERENIEKEIGSPLEWHERPTGVESWVLLRRPTDPSDQSAWSDQHEWLWQTLMSFYKSFASRVKK